MHQNLEFKSQMRRSYIYRWALSVIVFFGSSGSSTVIAATDASSTGDRSAIIEDSDLMPVPPVAEIVQGHDAPLSPLERQSGTENLVAADVPRPMPPQGPECVKNWGEYRKSVRLQQLLGPTYNPFVRWSGPMGAAIEPDGKGSMVVTLPEIAAMFSGRPARSALPFQLCANPGKKTAYVKLYKLIVPFDDLRGNVLTLSDRGQSGTFHRDETVSK